ncbi:ABC transporter substrate-binding protein [Actinobacteria bacterium YIM 96077]|uniref:ABC transporter substrate-binding protein n=1 Tax=Phytoactinopolyspora halophila TaxID=1981511 RepID=A0A329QH08_9ACTN|nr:ABC transporter substrate-binding protein [Phytoactinopolyspora halophila]AYY14709.1 ABC transporter substrate-binding protein [Actinobacteria bacterium YIM 96077]RAW11580.1 ABC transporter substrate-binding protein [Phytoactinopolyspora halophila]
MRARRFRGAAAFVLAGAFALAACGGDDDTAADDDGGEAGDSSLPVVLGTTDTVTNIDPAGSYDKPSWNIVYNTYQRLLAVPLGGSEPQPDAAESCDWDDDTTYRCTLKSGQTFADGSEITSENVVHSIERQLEIQHESNGWQLLTGIEEVEAPDESTVVFHLESPDATFPFILTTAAAAIVPMDYPADELQPNDQVVGSGPYTVDEFDPTQQIQLGVNENYAGDREVNNSGVILQFYQTESALKQAIEEGEVMIAYRSLAVTDVEDLEENGAERGVEVVVGEGTEINYMVLQASREPFDEPAVRQAVAQIIDRETIAESVYRGTVTPLYGPIPEGVPGHVPSFKEQYGEPDPEAAEQLLDEAGVETPVEFDAWWMPDRYGEEIGDMFGEIERQLEDTGLFEVNLEQLSWAQYAETFSDQSMDAFDLGWFPDYPDASNYIEPFYHAESVVNNGYSDDEMDELIDVMLTDTDEEARLDAFERASEIVAEDAPIIQLWQRDQIAAVREGVEGVEETLDPSFIFYYDVVSGVEE